MPRRLPPLNALKAFEAVRPDIAARFPTDAIFRAIRLEPYLVAAAAVHHARDHAARDHRLRRPRRGHDDVDGGQRSLRFGGRFAF